jgi:transcriptional regulator with XRE-family HTH domain
MPSSIGQRIRQVMQDRKISSKELAQSAQVPASSLAQWINYKKQPRPDVLLRIARCLDVSIEWLITGEQPEVRLAKEIIGAMETKWAEIHQGTYRVRIEKQVDGTDRTRQKKKMIE